MEDTLLNPVSFKKLNHIINKTYKKAKENSVPARKLEIMRSNFKYIKTFETKGIQGVVGILEHRDSKQQFIFKLSLEINRSIEHENLVTLELNKIKDFCPNFVGNLGCIELPISRTYIYAYNPESSDEEESSGSERSDRRSRSESSDSESSDSEYEDYPKEECDIFMEDREYLPTNVLFLEYVSPYSFDDFCRYADKSLLNSLILGVLCGLGVAQKHLNFTHYDLHIDNILIKECEPEAVFMYKIDDNIFTIPTFGFFPVIIDMGLSYCNALNGTYMKTPVEHYDKGLQSTYFDKFNDVHHFLLSALYSVEYDEEEFYYLSTKMLYFFRSVPVFRKKGWKSLPNSILKLAMKEIVDECRGKTTGYKPKEKPKSKIEELRLKKIGRLEPEKTTKSLGLYELPVWIDLDIDIIETISLGIPLPWKEELEKDMLEDKGEDVISYSFLTFIRQLQKFYDIEDFEDTNDLLFMIRELVTLVYENWNIINKNISKDTAKKLFNDYKRKIIPDFRDYVYKLDWVETIVSCKYCLNVLSVLYSKHLKDNVKLVEECYDKMEMKSVIDIIKFYIKNAAIRPVYSNKTVIYVWDADNKSNKRVMLKDILSEEEIRRVDKMTPQDSSKFLSSKVC